MKKMSLARKNWIAILITVVPINIYLISYRIFQTKAFKLSDMLIYPLLVGIPCILIILAVNRYFLRYTFQETFKEGDSTWVKDLLFTVILVVVYFILLKFDNIVLRPLLPNNHVASDEVINALIELSGKPILILFWFGPVLWIGVGLFEEITRTFALKCLWNVSSNKLWQVVAIILVSFIVGMTHMYQGSAGVISIGIKSIIAGLFFYKYRRITPLILAHVLYDGIQFADVIIMIRGL